MGWFLQLFNKLSNPFGLELLLIKTYDKSMKKQSHVTGNIMASRQRKILLTATLAMFCLFVGSTTTTATNANLADKNSLVGEEPHSFQPTKAKTKWANADATQQQKAVRSRV